MSEHEEQYGQTMDELRNLAAGADMRGNERAKLQHELDEIRAMLEKLEHGRIEITVFGEINSGKSSVLNALLGKELFKESGVGGETRTLRKEDWKPQRCDFTGETGARLVVVDTPGINEVAGKDRAAIATETVRYSDIALFVTSGDLNEVEFQALQTLRSLNKPVVLVINKIDLFSKLQLAETCDSIRQKVKGMIAEEDIALTAACPLKRERIRVDSDGNEISEEFTPKPIVEDLQVRILEILRQEHKALVALNANLFAAEISGRIAELKVQMRADEANAVVRKFMFIKAAVMALDPIPAADIIGGAVADVTMVRNLAAIYGRPLSVRNAKNLILTICRAWGGTMAVEVTTHTISSILKGVTFGMSVGLTAVPQAVVAAWSTYVIGQAATVYFKDAGWGSREPKTIIEEILKRSDKKSILAPLAENIRNVLRGRTKTQLDAPAISE